MSNDLWDFFNAEIKRDEKLILFLLDLFIMCVGEMNISIQENSNNNSNVVEINQYINFVIKNLQSGNNQSNFVSTLVNNSSIANLSVIGSNITMIVKEGMNSSILNNNKYNLYRNFLIPISLQDEEERENRPITGLTKEFHKEIKHFFKNYLTEINDTVTKANFLKMLRDIGIGNEILTLEELTKLGNNSLEKK